MGDGGAGLFTNTGGHISMVADTTGDPFRRFYSHPDIDNQGALSFYADLKSGDQGIFLIKDGQLITLAETGELFTSVGPLGPTMNDRGQVAFRADTTSGESRILIGTKEEVITIAETGRSFCSFEGLPVTNSSGTVVFRTVLKDGRHGIYTSKEGTLTHIADTGSGFNDLGRFPTINNAGTVAFNAIRTPGMAGIFTVAAGKITTVVGTSSPFESYRGILLTNAGAVIFYATPKGGELGIFCGPDPSTDGILSIGETLFGSKITEFALNPVSINAFGQIAIRIKLANEKQLFVRADPTK